jgi:hypothetical protein
MRIDKKALNDELSIANIVIIKPDAETSSALQGLIPNLFRDLVNKRIDKKVANDELSIANIVIIKPDAETSSALNFSINKFSIKKFSRK